MAGTPTGWFDSAFPGRCRGDRGVALVEAGILSGPFLFLLLMIFDGSTYGRWILTASNAASAGVRSAAVQGSNALADYQILLAAKNGMPGIPANGVSRVVVFKAASATSGPSCTTGSSVTNSCNVYLPADLALVPAANPSLYFGNCPTTIRDCYWKPSTRKTALAGTNGPPDYIGVYIKLNFKSPTGLLGTKTIEQTIVSKIEPTSIT